MLNYAYLTFFPAVINLGLGVYAWSRNPEARENRLLALSCLGLSVYCFRTFEVNTRPFEFAERLFPLLTFGPLLAGAALSDFLLTISGRPLLPWRRLEMAVLYIPITFFSVGDIFTDWFYDGMDVADTGAYVPRAGPFSHITKYYLTILLLLVLGKAIRAIFSTDDYNRRKQLIWSVCGIGISVVSIIALQTLLPESIIPYARSTEILTLYVTLSTNLIASTMVYAIARYGLAPSIEELRRREAESRARQAELQHQLLDARMREERHRQEELEKELETAHRLQMALMPDRSPQIKGLSIAGRCTPATHVGGDYFQYFRRDGKLIFCIADVTGHAMQAAIPVVMFSGILHSQMELDIEVEELFDRLNSSLHRVLDRRTCVCFVLGELNLSTHVLRLANSGCPYPYYLNAASGRVEEVQINAYPLGVHADTVYSVRELQLEPDDLVVLCSDGLVDARDAERELFGFGGAGRMIVRGHAEGLEVNALLDLFADEVRAFTGGVPLDDDMTCIAPKIDPPS